MQIKAWSPTFPKICITPTYGTLPGYKHLYFTTYLLIRSAMVCIPLIRLKEIVCYENKSLIPQLGKMILIYLPYIGTSTSCAANFSFAQLAKRKSLGRSKPATNSQPQALQHTVWNVSTISKPYWTAFYRNKLSTTRCEWVRLFLSWRVQSAFNSVRSTYVERSQLYNIV